MHMDNHFLQFAVAEEQWDESEVRLSQRTKIKTKHGKDATEHAAR